MVAQEEQGVERCAVVRQNPFGIPFLVPQGDPPATLPIEQLIVFTLADEIIIVARKETDTDYLAGTLHLPSVPYIVHIMGIIERQHVTVEKVLHATPRAHMEIAQQAFGLQCVACRIESVKLGHVAARPVGRKVTEILIFPFIRKLHRMITVVFQFGYHVYRQRIAEILAVGHLELAAYDTLQELVGTVVAEFTFQTQRASSGFVRLKATNPAVFVQKENISMPDLP